MDRKKLLIWELTGVFVIFIIGSLLHYVFEWSGYWQPVALIGAVNESTWEHLKVAFWPTLAFALVEYYSFGAKAPNFWLAKTVNLYLQPAVIIALFYGYKALLGHHLLWLDILIFFVAILAGQYLSYLILKRPHYTFTNQLAIPFLGLAMLMFTLFTFFPPRFFLFQDPQTGLYGLLNKKK